jgi:hypothetical protein
MVQEDGKKVFFGRALFFLLEGATAEVLHDVAAEWATRAV